MENKEEVLRVLYWLSIEYLNGIGKSYSEINTANLHLGICRKLRSDNVSQDILKVICENGFQYIKENKKHLKKIFPLCFKKTDYNMKYYWCEACLFNSCYKDTQRQSLAFRFYVLNEIRIKIQLL